MSRYHTQTATRGHFTGVFELDSDRAALIKMTYFYLAFGVLAAVSGGYVGATTPALLKLFTSIFGWVIAIVALNVIPMIAVACRHNPVLGFSALVLDGFVAGLVLGPLLYFALLISAGRGVAGNLVIQAGLMTAVVFIAVTATVWLSGKRFSAPRGLMVGIFFSIIAASLLNAMFFHSGMVAVLVSAGVGIFGVAVLVYATSDLLHDPSIETPIEGAVMLFAGLFNVFTAILHILLAFTHRD